MTIHQVQMLILGSGPAGATAAIYAARAGLKPIIVQGNQPGGQLTITTDVENYPGFREAQQGPILMENMLAQAESFGTTLIYDNIISVDLKNRPFTAIGESGDEYLAESMIICTGAQAKWLGLPSEDRYKGFGVSGCAVCDAFFFRNKEVAVIGGGNSAVEEALYLSNHARKVWLIHRRDQLRAEKILQERLFANPKIEVIWNNEVTEIIGETAPHLQVTGVKLYNNQNGKSSSLALDGVFVAIGHEPNTSLFKGQIAMDKQGYIITTADSTQTNVNGVFAAGDVRDRVFRQAVTAAGNGCMAALEAEKFLAEQNYQSTRKFAEQQYYQANQANYGLLDYLWWPLIMIAFICKYYYSCCYHYLENIYLSWQVDEEQGYFAQQEINQAAEQECIEFNNR